MQIKIAKIYKYISVFLKSLFLHYPLLTYTQIISIGFITFVSTNAFPTRCITHTTWTTINGYNNKRKLIRLLKLI